MKYFHQSRYVTLKLLHIILLMLMVYLVAFGIAQAQSEQITIPLSNPGQPGVLTVQLVRGSITIQGYNGEEVVLQTPDTQKNEEDDLRTDGLRKISSNSFDLEAIEENNRVFVKSKLPNRAIHLEIQVPVNFSVKAKTVNDGQIRIENLKGEIEANNVNGAIYLKDISGSVVANTVNGELVITFNEVTSDTPMSFTTLNGDIDATFPAATKMTARIKTLNGEIFTDFDMQITNQGNRQTSKEDGRYRVKLDNQITGRVNGGGPEMFFQNHNGNIYIRKR